MPDVFLRVGEANPNDVRLRDTTLADVVGGLIRRYFYGRSSKAGDVRLTRKFYYRDETG